MKWAICVALLIPGLTWADEKKDAKEVNYIIYTKGYFEKNNSGLKGEQSFWASSDQAEFDKIFGIGFVMGPRPVTLPKDKDDFAKLMVISTIKRGNVVTDYTLNSISTKDGILLIDYKADSKGPPGTAMFASPLLLSVTKADYKAIHFIENGKKVGQIDLKK